MFILIYVSILFSFLQILLCLYMLWGNRRGRKSKSLIWSHCNPAAKFPLLQSWIISRARLCASNQYFEKFSFNLRHKKSFWHLVKNVENPRQFILFKHWNTLLGKAIPTTMTAHKPKAGFSLKSVVLAVKSKPKLSDFFQGTQKQVWGPPIFHCRWLIWDYYLLGSSIESRLHFVSLIPAG